MARGKSLLIHHFALSGITGVTALLAEVHRILPSIDSEIDFSYRYYEAFANPDEFIQALEAERKDVDCIIGINLHIEVLWDFSLALARWCSIQDVPLVNYVHDYWPHHQSCLRQLKERESVRLVASSPFIIDLLGQDGFRAGYVPVGAQIPDITSPTPHSPRKTIASCGRLTRRKRFPDVVRAFCSGRLDRDAHLHLRLLPSRVFCSDQDERLLHDVRLAIESGNAAEGSIEILMTPVARPDYSPFTVYVCASDYEGFSMAPDEAAYSGCPPIVSDIPPHRLMAASLFGERAADFLYPVTDTQALAEVLRDEIATGRRRTYLGTHLGRIRALIEERYSINSTARALVTLYYQLSNLRRDDIPDEWLGINSSGCEQPPFWELREMT